ncbi:MAG: B12-binding domain-containing radical SAM protein, partial [Candidatus Diapherotrites archaeon]|nr:B12-binding domain-containing radical SAM protein [Candidatus Diapherotrites archaeon]
MKIVTLSAPYFDKFSRNSRSPAVSKGGCVYYPIWLAYTTGVLEQNGHDVKLIDAPACKMSME